MSLRFYQTSLENKSTSHMLSSTLLTQVALIKPGKPYTIVTNVESKRKTPNYLAFYGEERLFGGHAEAKRGSKPRHVIPEPFKVLGRGFHHPRSLDYSNNSFHATETVINERGGVSMVVPPGSLPAGTGEHVFSAEEASVQLLTHVREFTDAFAELKVPNAVLTVPMYATQAERLSLLDVAQLAGFKVLSLVEENTAAGIHYGIDRVSSNGTHYMIVYNMGAESTQVTLFAYDSYNHTERGSSKPTTVGQGRVLAKAYDLELSGEALDKLLVEHVASAFNADPKVNKMIPKEASGDIRKIPAAMVKISKAVVKAKEVLSANEAFPVSLEGVLADVDFRIMLNRTLLESLAATLWPRVTSIIQNVLTQANLTTSQVNAVELVGGAVRVPKVQVLLKEFFSPAQVGTHMNGDECFALGAVFVAANRSTSMKVRKVGMVEGAPFAVGVRLGNLDPEDAKSSGAKPWSKRSPNLFGLYHPVDEKKRISFNATKDLFASLYYENATSGAPELPSGTSKTLGVYSITGLNTLMANETFAARGTPKVHLTFHLDIFGVVTLAKAEATQEIEEPEPVKPPSPLGKNVNATKDVNATNTTKEAQVPKNDTETAAAAAVKMVKTTLRFPLSFTLNLTGVLPVAPLTQQCKDSIVTRGNQLKAEDDKKRALDTAKSDLEAAIYKYRDNMESQREMLEKVTTEEQRGEMDKAPTEYLEWHENDGPGASLEEYKKKKTDLMLVMDPAFSRAYEAKVRGKTLESARAEIISWTELIQRWNVTHPQVSLAR